MRDHAAQPVEGRAVQLNYRNTGARFLRRRFPGRCDAHRNWCAQYAGRSGLSLWKCCGRSGFRRQTALLIAHEANVAVGVNGAAQAARRIAGVAGAPLAGDLLEQLAAVVGPIRVCGSTGCVCRSQEPLSPLKKRVG